MTNIYDNKDDTVIVFVLFILILLFVIIVFLFNVVRPFLEAKKYIKMEMMRSEGEEYRYWKKELKKLYIQHIPFVGRFFR